LSIPTRPSGVTVLAALWILLGVLSLLGGGALTIVGFHLPEVFRGRAFAVRSMFVGVVLIVVALTSFGLAYGLWKGKAWSWIASLAFVLFGIVFSVFSLSYRPGLGELVGLVVYLLSVYYLMQPRVKSFFGKGAVASAS
jgi:uncharacterized membrane protein (DUF2068 family)